MLNRSGEKGQPYPLDLSSSLLIWGEKNNFINIIFDTCKVFIDILYQIKEVSPDSFPGLTCKVFCRGDRRGYRRSFLFSCRTAIPLSHLWITSALLRDFFFFLISLWVLCSIQVDKVCRRKQSPQHLCLPRHFTLSPQPSWAISVYLSIWLSGCIYSTWVNIFKSFLSLMSLPLLCFGWFRYSVTSAVQQFLIKSWFWS